MAGAPLFRSVSFKVERGERLTIAGRNGAGKTTLLRMISGEAAYDGGELVFQKGARVALHDQRPPSETGLSLRDYVLSGRKDLIELEGRLRKLEGRMGAGESDQDVLTAYDKVQQKLEHAGGYVWRERSLQPVHNLGFSAADLDRNLETFSGGELTRASLARALAAEPDLLLLDEPTNHLDLESLEWLEGELAASKAAIVLVAHDRWFLEAVGTSVLEIEAGRSRFFAGTWHNWRREQIARDAAFTRTRSKQEDEIARLERFVTRFRAGTRSRQAQSRAKRIEKIDLVEADPRDTRRLGFKFAETDRTGRVVLNLKDATIEIGDRTLIDNSDLWLERGEHVVLVGSNGSGKTTLINTLCGLRPLEQGKLSIGHNVRIQLLSQHAAELGEQGTVLDVCQRETKLTPNSARALLGRFMLGNDDVKKSISSLSGGERRRLSLAILVHSQANLLVLDEPTNHLDIESREALEEALSHFDGTILLVSHDRAMLEAVGTRTVVIEDGKLRNFEGGWLEWLEHRESRREAAQPALKAKAKVVGRLEKSAPAGKSKNRVKRIGQLEREIENAESQLAALEYELADPAAWSEAEAVAKSQARHKDAQERIAALYAELETLEDS